MPELIHLDIHFLSDEPFLDDDVMSSSMDQSSSVLGWSFAINSNSNNNTSGNNNSNTSDNNNNKDVMNLIQLPELGGAMDCTADNFLVTHNNNNKNPSNILQDHEYPFDDPCNSHYLTVSDDDDDEETDSTLHKNIPKPPPVWLSSNSSCQFLWPPSVWRPANDTDPQSKRRPSSGDESTGSSDPQDQPSSKKQRTEAESGNHSMEVEP